MKSFKSFLNDRIDNKEWLVTKTAKDAGVLRPVDKITASHIEAPNEKMKVLKHIKGSLCKK